MYQLCFGVVFNLANTLVYFQGVADSQQSKPVWQEMSRDLRLAVSCLLNAIIIVFVRYTCIAGTDRKHLMQG